MITRKNKHNRQKKGLVVGSILANEIATALLTVQDLYGPLECDRAQMMCSDDRGKETGHGGRDKQGIVDAVDAVLVRNGIV